MASSRLVKRKESGQVQIESGLNVIQASASHQQKPKLLYHDGVHLVKFGKHCGS